MKEEKEVIKIEENEGDAAFVGLLFSFANALKKIFLEDTTTDYERRKVAPKVRPKDNNRIGVSTCWGDDIQCYETALIDAEDKVYPVERYKNKESAIKGHKKWLILTKNAKNIKVKVLGSSFLLTSKNRLVILKKEELKL